MIKNKIEKMSNISIKNFINALSKTNEQYKINYWINKLPNYLLMVLPIMKILIKL